MPEPRFHDWLRRLREVGRTQSELAEKLGRTKTAMSRIMTGERRDLRGSEIEAIEAQLAEWEGKNVRPAGLIPLLGYAAAGGEDRISWAMDRPLDWVEAPPMRDNSAQVVAIRVSGDSMEPRLFGGETVYVGLNILPARGGDAVIEFTDNTALVKSYFGRRQGYVHAHQYNPDKALTFAETSVRGLHAVLWRR